MTTHIYQALLGMGILALIAIPLAILTFPFWESPLIRWLDRRRREREMSVLRKGTRWAR